MRHIVALIGLALLVSSADSLQAQTRLMPLGNSITQGVGSSGDNKGYRKPLWNMLKNKYDVDFVGTLQDGDGSFDVDHDGHPGERADGIKNNVTPWLQAENPDMVVLHIGTNDISGGRTTQQIVNNLNGTLDRIWDHNSATLIFLCQIAPRTTALDAQTVSLNAGIANIVSNRGGSNKLYLVDVYSAITSATNWETAAMADSIHPNNTGYQLMAQAIFDEIRDFLSPVTPVELVSFQAALAADGVRLSWQTATETNNYGFEVEHRLDDAPFAQIGFVAGNGTISTPRQYDFLHPSPGTGRHEYRLRQVDTDGTFAFTDTVRVTVGPPALMTLRQAYPNPFSPVRRGDGTAISFSLPVETTIAIAIYDIRGREVATILNGSIAAGTHAARWDGRLRSGAPAPPGTYFIRMRSATDVRVQKLLLLP